MELPGQPVAVVGGASGLGAATAKALARAGAKVAVLDINFAMATELAESIDGVAARIDVTSAESAEATFRAITARIGAPRVLINTAGIAPAAKIFGKTGPMPLEEFKKGIEVNLIGTFNTMRIAVAGMAGLAPLEDGERGVIVNTASVAGYEGQIGQASYAASKAGVIGLTIQAARELASLGIRVCTIAPGLFETPMMAGLPENVRASLASTVPFPPRLGRDDEYARQALNIVQSVYLNGETLRLDAGLRMASR